MDVSVQEVFCVENICRTCMSNENKLIPLFDSYLEDIQDKNLAEVLKICTDLKIEQNDGLPSQICENCTKNLNISYNFKSQSIETDATLREMIKNSTTNIIEIKEEQIKEEILDCCESIISYEKDSDIIFIENDQNFVEQDQIVTQIEKKRKRLPKTTQIEYYKSENDQYFEESIQKKETFPQPNKKRKNSSKLTIKITNVDYSCEFCCKKFRTKRNLILHKKKCEKLKILKAKIVENIESSCEKCGKVFSTKSEFLIHAKLNCTSIEIVTCEEEVLEKDNVSNYFCEKCGKTYTKRSFLAHKKINCAQIFECEECNLEFSSRKELRDHSKNHKPLLKCKMCPKMFRSSYGLDYHSKRHEGIENYSCPFENCTKKFAIKRALDKHILIHSKDSSYLCYKCGQSFTTSDALYYHIKTHDGRKPHLCTFCGKTFKQTCHLKNHMWIHTGIKPYECDKCKKRFTRLKSLKKHKLKHCHSLDDQNVEIVRTDS